MNDIIEWSWKQIDGKVIKQQYLLLVIWPRNTTIHFTSLNLIIMINAQLDFLTHTNTSDRKSDLVINQVEPEYCWTIVLHSRNY